MPHIRLWMFSPYICIYIYIYINVYIYIHLCLHIHVYIYIVGTSYCSDFFQFSGILQYAWCFTFHISKLSGNSQPKTTASWNIYQAVGYPSRCCWILYIYIYINFGALWKHYEKHEDIITSVFCLITFIYNDIHTFITFYTYVIYIYIRKLYFYSYLFCIIDLHHTWSWWLANFLPQAGHQLRGRHLGWDRVSRQP